MWSRVWGSCSGNDDKPAAGRHCPEGRGLTSSRQARLGRGTAGAGELRPDLVQHIGARLRRLPAGGWRRPVFLWRSPGACPSLGLWRSPGLKQPPYRPSHLRCRGRFPGASLRGGLGPERTRSLESFSAQNPQTKMATVTINRNQPDLGAPPFSWPCTWARGSVWPPSREWRAEALITGSWRGRSRLR